MSILIKGMEMPKGKETATITICSDGLVFQEFKEEPSDVYSAIQLPPHGDLIDRDALMKDGWLSLWKRVDYMGGYAVHDLPLINPSIPVVLESEE